jgi:hypothetical protein
MILSGVAPGRKTSLDGRMIFMWGTPVIQILVLAGKHVSQALGYIAFPSTFQSRGLFVDFDFLI